MYSTITPKLSARGAVLHVNKTAPQSAYKLSEFYVTKCIPLRATQTRPFLNQVKTLHDPLL